MAPTRTFRRLAVAAMLVLSLAVTSVAATGASAANRTQTSLHAKKAKRKAIARKRQIRHGSTAPRGAAERPSAPVTAPAIAGNTVVETAKVSIPTPTKPTPVPTLPSAPTPTAPTPTSPTPSTPPSTPTPALAESGFEEGLRGWNTAGVGEVVPTTESWNVREGRQACDVTLTGSQNRSELIFGGNGNGSTAGTVEFENGAEYWYGLSINVLQMTYGRPGAHNLFMQFKSEGEGSPNFGLQLWDWEGKKGLWSHSEAMGGDRYLAPLSEDVWHEVLIHFRAANDNTGWYELFLDGNLIDSRQGVSMIVPGKQHAYIKDGLYRNGGTNPGTSEILLDAARLGTSRSAVLAR